MMQGVFHQRWWELHNSIIVSISSGALECYVQNPPSTKESAINLAWEHYIYCPDIIDQGIESISKYAEQLINSNYWYFWWD